MADIAALLRALTLEEKASLTAGGGMFSTTAVERVGIPQVNVSDGPSGARGLSFPGLGGPSSTCIPCGSAIGASWNPALAERLGALVGRESLDRGCRGLLAPTVNLHRSPLAGRNFECYSEDPLLSGRLAAAYVRGVQSNGVFATVKHFVGNEAEFERASMSSVVDERSLRELYLLPFEIAIREGGALGVMTSYNRLNGKWLTEQPALLLDLLRDDWRFEGLVMTDWFAVADTTTSLGSGLDLEMPGPGRALGANVLAAVTDGRVDASDLDAAVGRLLTALDRIGALDGPEPPHELAPSTVEERSLLRQAAAEATVLLTNDGTLPLDPAALTRVAVIGPFAETPCIVGGGSAQVIPHRVVTPLEALREVLGDGVEIAHERGCEASRTPMVVGATVLRAPLGFDVERFAGTEFEGEVVERRHLETLRSFVAFGLAPAAAPGGWSERVRGSVVSDEEGVVELGLAQAGRARVFVDGQLVLDGFVNPPPAGGADFFGHASQDLLTDMRFERGVGVDVVVEHAVEAGRSIAGFRLGFRTPDLDRLLDRAAAAAAPADVAIVYVGNTEHTETEGHDREQFGLPGRQDDLIRRVAAANPRTVVVVNAGSVVDLPWTDDVAAVLQCWFGGEEMAAGVADVLIAAAEPGGRLPTTVPVDLRHNPSYDNFPGENGELRYGEGLFMGYRGYEHRGVTPRFPFGHGLSYTSFEIGEPVPSAPAFRPGDTLTVSVPVMNTGNRAGTVVVQCYVAPDSPRLCRPPKELKAFAKVGLTPGETTTVELVLDDRSFAYWDPGQQDWDEIASRVVNMFGGSAGSARRHPGWQVDAGRYEVLIGRSSQDIAARAAVEVVRG
jgi:beta-glucosidase